MSLSTNWTKFTILLIIWAILVLATVTVMILMVSEIAEAHHMLRTINTTTSYIEKLLIIAHSSSHILTAMLYAIILLTLVILDIVVAKEMFKE
jgi:hypothetical protein